jgi:hypothetical protein
MDGTRRTRRQFAHDVRRAAVEFNDVSDDVDCMAGRHGRSAAA